MRCDHVYEISPGRYLKQTHSQIDGVYLLVILTSNKSGTLVFRDSVPPQYRYDIIICREVKGLIK